MPHSFESAAAALHWLYSTQRFGMKLGLEGMLRLRDALALPSRDEPRFIHVAGTNGKGSTCAFIHQLLTTAGFRAGLFTSPHLIRFNERIRDSEREITDDELRQLLSHLRALVADWDPHPTFFELTLALALLWFHQRQLDWVALETGLGGRLDATNIVLPAATVITRIGYDHMEILGDTLEKIAREKAGIIKPGVPLITGPQEPAARAVLEQVAAEKNAPFHLIDQPWTASPLGLAGSHQALNAALAIAAVRAAGVPLSDGQITTALAATRWPGRFEAFPGDITLDGAHNADSVSALVETWHATRPGTRPTVVFGAVREKDLNALLQRLAPIVGAWHLTAFDSPRALPPAEIAANLRSLGLDHAPIHCHDSPQAALAAARGETGATLVCGSLYLVGAVRALLTGNPDAYQSSSQ